VQTDNTKISRAVKQAARWQLVAIVLVATVSLLFAGINAAISAILGGFSVLAGSFSGARFVRGKSDAGAAGVIVNVLKAEAIKILVIVVMLFATFKFYAELVPVALIGGLAVSALFAGAGLRVINDKNS
jgi:ATP synthase protein I